MRRTLTSACALIALLLALPGAAAASPTQESILQDDPQLLDATSAAQVDRVMATLKAIGVDRVRVSVFWDRIAPAAASQTRPRFPGPGAWWPGSYPRGTWDRYDEIVLAARRYGLGLLFTLTGPAPAWATPGARSPEGTYNPSAADFRDFVTAVGTRYSGAYSSGSDPRPPASSRPPIRIGPITLGQDPPPAPSPYLVPRVDTFSIWNEPNYPQWLTPIWLANRPRRAADMVAAAPARYRRLVDAGWAGLAASGHARDRIIIGETAPRGGKDPRLLGNAMAPAEFARELYCVRPSYRPYTGRAARLRGCPTTAAERRSFRADHPGLFRAAGYGMHPYSLDRNRWRLPTWRHPLADNVPIGNLGRLTSTLDRATRAWGARGTRLPIWITEYGYQTKPDDPNVGVARSRQGPLSAWGEYLAYRNPRVASVAQFLLVDDKPLPGFSNPRDRRRWITWQSGLFTASGEAKPFALDYQRPLYVTRRGRLVRVFGTYRPGINGARYPVAFQWRPAGGPWRNLATGVVTNPEGYVVFRRRTPGPGFVRLVYLDPATGRPVASRRARIR